MDNVGISVIMPSYLGEYPGSRKNPDKKFIRAVESFRSQTFENKELIIISDGCELTNQIYQEKWQQDPTIRLIRSEKMEVTWPGELREIGRSIAKYDWISYLDSDDVILSHHLETTWQRIHQRQKDVTVFFNMKYVFSLPEKPTELLLKTYGFGHNLNKYHEVRNSLSQPVIPGFENFKMAIGTAQCHCSTWQVIHHKYVPHRWKNSKDMGEDSFFCEELKKTEKWQEINCATYIISHYTVKREIMWDM